MGQRAFHSVVNKIFINRNNRSNLHSRTAEKSLIGSVEFCTINSAFNGFDTVFADLSILTQDIDLVNKEYCEGTALDFNYHLGQTFDPAHVTAYLLYPAGTTLPSTVTTTVNYIPMDNLTLASGSTLSPLSTFTINDYLTYKVV